MYPQNPQSQVFEIDDREKNDENYYDEKMKNEGNDLEGLTDQNQKELAVGQKRKYTKRMQNQKQGDGDSKSVSNNGKDKNMGRWTREEKQKFIDAIRWHGKDWKKVEQSIKTRSGAQIRSHAQKFFQNKMKSEGIDIDQYILQLQQNEGHNKDVESSNHDDENLQEKQNQLQNSIEKNLKSFKNTINSQEMHPSFKNLSMPNKYVSVVNIDAPQNIQDDPVKLLQVLQASDQMTTQKMKKPLETETLSYANNITNERQRQHAANIFQQQGLFFSSSTPSEISSYMHQNLINKLAQNRKDQSIQEKTQQKFKGPLNIHNLNDKNQFQLFSNNKLKQQALQYDQMNNQTSLSIQNIFAKNSGQDAKSKNLKLSPSKLNSPIQNLQKINTAKWNDSHQFLQEQMMHEITKNQNQQFRLVKNQKSVSPQKQSKIKIHDECDSPIKITVCDETCLEVLNLDFSKVNLDFQELWDLQLNSKSCKSNDWQIYSDNPSLILNQFNYDLNLNKSQKQILQIPKILRKLKSELECFNPRINANSLNNQVFKIDSIKICWHMNKNELFVYDFQEKVLENKQYEMISIINILEKSKASQKARIRNIQTKQMVKDFQISNGTYIILQGGNIQKMSYEVPKVTARISDQIGRRISLIFFHKKSEISNQAAIKNLDDKINKQITKLCADSQKERNISATNLEINGKTPFFGGNNITNQLIFKKYRDILVGKNQQNLKYLKTFTNNQNENSSDTQLQTKQGILEVNKKVPSQLNLHSQDGNFRISKQIRERANSGLTIQQTNSLRKNNFNLNKQQPLIDQQNSNKKSVEFLNYLKDRMSKKKTQEQSDNINKNGISTFLNQNNLFKDQTHKIRTENHSVHEKDMDNKSQQESLNSFLLKKNQQISRSLFRNFLPNQDQNITKNNTILNPNSMKQNKDLLNLLQPLIQQKKNSPNDQQMKNFIHSNQQTNENQSLKIQNAMNLIPNQQLAIKSEDQQKQQQFNYINEFKKNYQQETGATQGSYSPAIESRKQNFFQKFNKNLSYSLKNLQSSIPYLKNQQNEDMKNQGLNVGNFTPIEQQMIDFSQQHQENNQIGNENENKLERNRRISVQSGVSKVQSTNTPLVNWNYAIQSLKQPANEQFKKISDEKQLAKNIKVSIDSSITAINQPDIDHSINQIGMQTQGFINRLFEKDKQALIQVQETGEDQSCVQSKTSQIDSFIGLMRQQNQSIMEGLLEKTQNKSNFQNPIQYQDIKHQIILDQESENQTQDKLHLENEMEAQDYCASLKSVQNILTQPKLKQQIKSIQDQISCSSKTGIENQLQYKQKIEDIINKHFNIIQNNLDQQSIEILNQQKNYLLQDLLNFQNQNELAQSFKNIQKGNTLVQENQKKSEIENQHLDQILQKTTEQQNIQLKQNELMIDQLISKKQYLFYNFFRTFGQFFDESTDNIFKNIDDIKNEQSKIEDDTVNQKNLILINEEQKNEKKVNSLQQNDIQVYLKNYCALFSEIQNQLLKLYVKEIHDHQKIQQQQKITQNQQQNQLKNISTKNLINQKVIQEMIEILNFQILVNMNIHQIKQFKKLNANFQKTRYEQEGLEHIRNPFEISRLEKEEITPFSIEKFAKLIPFKYAQQIQINYIQSLEDFEHFQTFNDSPKDHTHHEKLKIVEENQKTNSKFSKIEEQQLFNPENFLLEQSPIFNQQNHEEQFNEENDYMESMVNEDSQDQTSKIKAGKKRSSQIQIDKYQHPNKKLKLEMIEQDNNQNQKQQDFKIIEQNIKHDPFSIESFNKRIQKSKTKQKRTKINKKRKLKVLEVKSMKNEEKRSENEESIRTENNDADPFEVELNIQEVKKHEDIEQSISQDLGLDKLKDTVSQNNLFP